MHSIIESLSALPDAIWSYDLLEQKFIYVNRKLADVFEIAPENLRDYDFCLHCIHPGDSELVRAEIEKGFKGGLVEIEYRIVIEGGIKWVLDRREVAFIKGVPVSMSGVISDITEKKLADLNTSSSEKAFRYLFINNPNPLWIYDRETLKFLAINNAAITSYGYTEKEFLEMTIADIRPSDDIPGLISSVNKVNNSFYSSGKYWRHIKKNGDIIYVDISGHGLKYKGRNAEIIMAHDITREVESRKKTALAKKNLHALINNIGDAIWSIDSSYRVISANIAFNASMMARFGRYLQLGDDIFLPELPELEKNDWKTYYDRALAGEAFSFIYMSVTGSGSYYTETKMSPIKDQDETIGVACISNNIQERIENQRKIVQQNKVLLELLSLSSHELRGPVASLLGLTNIFNTRNYADPLNAEIIEHVHELSSQLDQVIHTLVEKTYSLQRTNETSYVVQHSQ